LGGEGHRQGLSDREWKSFRKEIVSNHDPGGSGQRELKAKIGDQPRRGEQSQRGTGAQRRPGVDRPAESSATEDHRRHQTRPHHRWFPAGGDDEEGKADQSHPAAAAGADADGSEKQPPEKEEAGDVGTGDGDEMRYARSPHRLPIGIG
jgi:hypothetical protein